MRGILRTQNEREISDMSIGFTLVEGEFAASEGVEVSWVDMSGLFIT